MPDYRISETGLAIITLGHLMFVRDLRALILFAANNAASNRGHVWR